MLIEPGYCYFCFIVSSFLLTCNFLWLILKFQVWISAALSLPHMCIFLDQLEVCEQSLRVPSLPLSLQHFLCLQHSQLTWLHSGFSHQENGSSIWPVRLSLSCMDYSQLRTETHGVKHLPRSVLLLLWTNTLCVSLSASLVLSNICPLVSIIFGRRNCPVGFQSYYQVKICIYLFIYLFIYS